ncbi:hypothetical protein TRFO_15829 [Tritrichomonas foetus]|uniref:Uncharacterized protein n=1 Tax=Tritrichomonas foetus TaxID=1144522 RepID=A0A1J4KRP5_9EUKA|nr:hypothetical protein TRFO_15829 [Tritrichomonas foetus]|eukprot:OHT13931.1 hypothetical protein TRFO_15829 [Tritrichomonas foetus]
MIKTPNFSGSNSIFCQIPKFEFMKAIVRRLVEGTSPDKSPHDITASLSLFQQEINIHKLYSAEEDQIDLLLKTIWTQLLTCSASQNVSVRVAAYTATSNFLLKLMPYYPLKMRTTFSDVAIQFSGESQNSLLLIASFAFISHFISPANVDDFLSATPIFHHFITNECISSDHLSNIIHNLDSHLSNDWFKNLLLAFINLNNHNPSRHITKAVSALIQKNPDVLMKEILIYDNNWSPAQLSLISYVMTSVNFDLDTLDLLKTEVAAFECLKKEGSSMTEIDDALAILSLKSKSFKINVKKVEEGFEIDLENYGKIIFNDEKAMKRASFYMLPLPKEYLIPKENDSPTIIGTKFKTIGNLIKDFNQIIDVETEIDLFDSYCTSEYNDTVSSCLQCLAICVNTLIMNCKTHKLSRLLRRVLFNKTTSWFHAFDILRVIRSIKPEFIPLVFGESGFKSVIQLVTGFCMHMNDDLSRCSFDTITELTSKETFREVTEYVSQNIDFFNAFSIQKNLLILGRLISKHYKEDRSHLFWLFNAVLESIDYHLYDVDVMTSIFHFFSFFNLSTIPINIITPLMKIATAIYSSTILVWAKNETYVPRDDEIKGKYFEIIRKHLSKKRIEIIQANSYDYRLHFVHLYSVMNFLLSLPLSLFLTSNTVNLFKYCFKLFPLECSRYLVQRIQSFNENDRLQIINDSYIYLEAVSDVTVHAIWCQILLQLNYKNTKSKLVSNIFKLMIKEASYFAEKYENKMSMKCLVSFAVFLGMTNSMHKNSSLLTTLIKKQNDETQFEFIQAITDFPDFSGKYKNLLMEIGDRYFIPSGLMQGIINFNCLIESQKKRLIEEILNMKNKFECKIPGNLISYANEHLYGWKLYEFNIKTNYFNDSSNTQNDIEPRAFNRICPQLYEEDLIKKLQIYADTDSLIGIKTTLCLIHSKNTKVDLSNVTFPLSTIPSVARFVKKYSYLMGRKNSSENFMENENDNDAQIVYMIEHKLEMEMPLIKYFFHPEMKFEVQKITKESIARISSFMQEFHTSIEGLSDVIIDNIKKTKSITRIKALLMLASVHLSMTKNLNHSDFVDQLFALLKEKATTIIPTKELLTFSLVVHQHLLINLEKHLDFIESVCLMFVLMECKVLRRESLTFDEYLNDLLKQNHPSFILQGIRILRYLIANEDVNAFKAYLENYISYFHQFTNIYPIPNYSSYLYVDIVENKFYSTNGIRNKISENLFKSILVPMAKAAFVPLGKVMISLVRTEDEASEFLAKLVKECEILIEDQTNLEIFQLYVDILEVRLTRVIDVEVRQRIVKNCIDKLVNGILKNFDSYNYSKYLESCISLIRNNLPIDDVTGFFIKAFLSSNTSNGKDLPIDPNPLQKRFFPFFVVIAKILKMMAFYKDDTNNNSVEKSIKIVKSFLDEKQTQAIDIILSGTMNAKILELIEGVISLK